MKFGEKLQRLRKKQGWTQEELAARIHVSRQALSRWEAGAATPDAGNVLQISKLFGVSTDYLLDDALESGEDIPAVPAGRGASAKKYTGAAYAVAGGIISAAGAAGLLVMAILGSAASPVIAYPSADPNVDAVVKHGLPAWLELNDLGWLFALCAFLLLTGVLAAVYSRLRSHGRGKRRMSLGVRRIWRK